MNIKKIMAARKLQEDAEKAMEAAIAEELPVGCTISYQHGHNEVTATVIEVYPQFGRLKVRGDNRAQREYWLDASRITGAWK